MKTPTLKEKVKHYETFLHKISLLVVCCNNDGIAELVHNADNWSYAHRRGEFITDKQRNEIINNAFWKLCDTPESDERSEARQKAYTEAQKQKAFLK
jgi:hypothetical protein